MQACTWFQLQVAKILCTQLRKHQGSQAVENSQTLSRAQQAVGAARIQIARRNSSPDAQNPFVAIHEGQHLGNDKNPLPWHNTNRLTHWQHPEHVNGDGDTHKNQKLCQRAAGRGMSISQYKRQRHPHGEHRDNDGRCGLVCHRRSLTAGRMQRDLCSVQRWRQKVAAFGCNVDPGS